MQRTMNSPVDVHAFTTPANFSSGRQAPAQQYLLSQQALDYAARVRASIDSNQFAQAIELLKSAEVNVVKEALLWQDQRGNTLLHSSVEAEGNCRHAPTAEAAQELIVLLLKRRANVNSQNNRGETPLHLAAQSGHRDVCQLLHKYQGDLDVRRNVDKRRPEDVAQHFGHNAVFEFLESIRLRDGGGNSGNSPLVGVSSSVHGVGGAARSTTPRAVASQRLLAPPTAAPLPFRTDSPQNTTDDVQRSSSGDTDESTLHRPISPASTSLNATTNPIQHRSAIPLAPKTVMASSKLQQRFTNDDGRRHKESQENKWKLDEFREKNRRLTADLRARSIQGIVELETAERRRFASDADLSFHRITVMEHAAAEMIVVAQDLQTTRAQLRACQVDYDTVRNKNDEYKADIAALQGAAAEQETHLTAVADSLGALRDEHFQLVEEANRLKAAHGETLAKLSMTEGELASTTSARDALGTQAAEVSNAHSALTAKFETLASDFSELQVSSTAAANESAVEIQRLLALVDANAAQHAAEKADLEAALCERQLKADTLAEALKVALEEASRLSDEAANAATTTTSQPTSESPRRAAALEELAELKGRAEATAKALRQNQQLLTTANGQLAATVAELATTATSLQQTQAACVHLEQELRSANAALGESEASRTQMQMELDDLRRMTTNDGASPTAEADVASCASRVSMLEQHQQELAEGAAAAQELKRQLAQERHQASKRIAQAEAITASAKRDFGAASVALEKVKAELAATSTELKDAVASRNTWQTQFTETTGALKADLAQTRTTMSQTIQDLKQQLAASEANFAHLAEKSTPLLRSEDGRLQLEATIAELRLELSTLRANRQETLTELRLARADAKSAEGVLQKRDAELQEVQSAHRIALLRLEDFERIRGDNAILTAERNECKRDALEAKTAYLLIEKDHDQQLARVSVLEDELYNLKKAFTKEHHIAQCRSLGLEEASMRKEVALVQWEAAMSLQQSIASVIMETALHAFRLMTNHQNSSQPQKVPLSGPRRVVMDPAGNMVRPTTSALPTSSLAVRAVSSLRSGASSSAVVTSTTTAADPVAALPQPHPPTRPSSATVRRELEDAELGITQDDSIGDDVLGVETAGSSQHRTPPHASEEKPRSIHNRPLSAALHGRQTHAAIDVQVPPGGVSFAYARVGPFLYSTSHESVREFYVHQCVIHRVRPIPEVLAALPDDKDFSHLRDSSPDGNGGATPASAEVVRQLSVANMKTLCRSSSRAVIDLFHVCPRIQLLDLSSTSTSDAAVLYLLVTLEVLCGYAPESPYAAAMTAGDANGWRSRLQASCSLKELVLSGTLVSDVQLLSGLASLVPSLMTVGVQRCKLLRDSSIPQLEEVLVRNRAVPQAPTSSSNAVNPIRPFSAANARSSSAAGGAEIDVSSMLKMKLEASALHFGRGRRPFSATAGGSSRTTTGLPTEF